MAAREVDPEADASWHAWGVYPKDGGLPVGYAYKEGKLWRAHIFRLGYMERFKNRRNAVAAVLRRVGT